MSFNSMYESIKRNIERFGTDLMLGIKTGSGSINFDTGKSEDVVQQYPIKGVISRYSDSQIIEGVIDIDDLKLTIQINADVKKGDIIHLFDAYYTVINVSSLIREGLRLKTVMQLRESYAQTITTCVYSIGGVDGTEFKMDGIWSKNCIMFRA